MGLHPVTFLVQKMTKIIEALLGGSLPSGRTGYGSKVGLCQGHRSCSTMATQMASKIIDETFQRVSVKQEVKEATKAWGYDEPIFGPNSIQS